MPRSRTLLIILLLVGSGCRGAANGYDGPLYDAMAQWQSMETDLDLLIRSVRASGVTRLALFTSRPEIDPEDERRLLAAQEKNPGFLVLGTPKLFRYANQVTEGNRKTLFRRLESKRYSFVSEIMVRHGDKELGDSNPGGERFIDPSGKEAVAIISGLSKFNVPLMIHWELYRWQEDLPRLDKLLSSFPRQIFILPHMGFGSPEQVRSLFEMHPNLWATISKKRRKFLLFRNKDHGQVQGSSILDDSDRIRPEWKGILEAFQDRILFATDAHLNYLWEVYPDLIRESRVLLGQLAPEVREKIAYKNAEHLYRVGTPGGKRNP